MGVIFFNLKEKTITYFFGYAANQKERLCTTFFEFYQLYLSKLFFLFMILVVHLTTKNKILINPISNHTNIILVHFILFLKKIIYDLFF